MRYKTGQETGFKLSPAHVVFWGDFLGASAELIESFAFGCKLSESIKINIKYLEKDIDKWKKFDIMKLQTNKKVHNKF